MGDKRGASEDLMRTYLSLPKLGSRKEMSIAFDQWMRTSEEGLKTHIILLDSLHDCICVVQSDSQSLKTDNT